MRLILIFLILLTSCNKDDKYDKQKAVSLYLNANKISVDKSLENKKLFIPPQKENNFWLGSSSYQNQYVENIKKDFDYQKTFFSLSKKKSLSITKNWQEYFIYLSDSSDSFVYSPIIKNNKIYFLTNSGRLLAYDLENKKKIWQLKIFDKSGLENFKTPHISYYEDKIFATIGSNKIVAVSFEGKIIWQKNISSILISAPISDGKTVFAISDNNKLYALDATSGEIKWIHSGIDCSTSIFGSADPVIYKDIIFASYSSSEVYALNKNNGQEIWMHDLNFDKAINSDFYLSDADASPIVKDNIAFLIANAGLMKAVNIKSGDLLWKKEIAGIVNFWIAGDYIYLINNDNKLLALYKKNGGIKWISDLPDFKNKKKPITKYIYSGISMAGDKIIISKNDGALIFVSPFDGKIEKEITIGKKIFHSPIIVNNKIYIFSIGNYFAELIEII